MKTPIHLPRLRQRVSACLERLAASLALLLAATRLLSAPSFTDWPQQAALEVLTAGLTEVSLPPAILDAARPGLEDLRLTDPEGVELPFYLRQRVPEPARFHPVRSFRVALQPTSTTLELATGLTTPVDAVRLQTPQLGFLKAVRLDGSRDGVLYELLDEGIPLFSQAGVSELTVRFPAGHWAWLRLTLDDQRTRPVVFTGASMRTAAPPSPLVPTTATVESVELSGQDTRITLNLGAANLTVAEITLDTPDTLFRREVVVNTVRVLDDALHETEIGRGLIYAIDLGAGIPARHQTITLESQVPSRELILLVRNQDSPPLTVTGVSVQRRSVELVFQAQQAGTHRLYLGNPQCPAPHYDLAALGGRLHDADRAPLTPGTLLDHPGYRAPELLPGVADAAALLDTRPWRYRKAVEITTPGPQQLELDLEVLGRAQSNLGDLRLVRAGHQVPYLVERSSLTRSITPEVDLASDPKNPSLSRWKIKLPGTHRPFLRLECQAHNPLFQRQMRLWEEAPTGRGSHQVRALGHAHWQHTPESPANVLTLDLTAFPRSDTLYLETDNGDNPALELGSFRLSYSVTRLVFKATEPLDLYYGQPAAQPPRYDLAMVAQQLLKAPRATAALGAGEILQAPGWTEGDPLTGFRAWMFWGMLALVVVSLLIIIARLLPRPSENPGDIKR